VYNLYNNSLPRVHVDKKLNEVRFSLTERQLNEMWNGIRSTVSPARRLCDLFWMSLPWGALANELGNVTALEVGCGSGVYGRLLESSLGDSFRRYVGVDIEADKDWKTYSNDPRFFFDVSRASDIAKYLPGSNLILTQSALEHFEEDLLYFDQVSQYVLRSQHPILQVHLVPSASCITTFPWHGVREYTPRTLSRITRLFGAETERYLFKLGATFCNRVHRQFITWPTLRHGVELRHTDNLRYQRDLRSAILHDFCSMGRSAAFYGLVLTSNFRDGHFLSTISLSKPDEDRGSNDRSSPSIRSIVGLNQSAGQRRGTASG
jgi:hypothetical protein